MVSLVVMIALPPHPSVKTALSGLDDDFRLARSARPRRPRLKSRNRCPDLLTALSLFVFDAGHRRDFLLCPAPVISAHFEPSAFD